MLESLYCIVRLHLFSPNILIFKTTFKFMNYIEPIIHLLKEQNKPVSIETIGDTLQLNKAQMSSLSKSMDELLSRGIIQEVQPGSIALMDGDTIIVGQLQFQVNGKAWVQPDEAAKNHQRLMIAPGHTDVGFHQDRVLARKVEPRRGSWQLRGRRRRPSSFSRPKDPEGHVLMVLGRNTETITGTLRNKSSYYFIVADNPRIVQEIMVPPPERALCEPKPSVGDKVLVRLKEWRRGRSHPEGEIIETWGTSHTPDAEQKALLHQFSLKETFPETVLAEAAALPTEVELVAMEGRIDCRNLLTVTIDPEGSEDFDDALSLEYLEGDSVRIGVHIADVGAYVQPGSALDREAEHRGNSTYLEGQVIPMLPSVLSNGLCSLLEDEVRLAKSVFFSLSAEGNITDTSLANTVIRSNKRLTYEQAYCLLNEDNLEAVRRNAPLTDQEPRYAGRPLSELSDLGLEALRDMVQTIWRQATLFREKRMAQGSLDINAPEIKIHLDQEGYARSISQQDDDESHQLVEEFMLAANEWVARKLIEAGLNAIHRVHGSPETADLDELHEYVGSFGIQAGDLNERGEMVSLLRMIREHPNSYTLRVEFLRKLQRANYRLDPEGHYGLNKKFYVHFTSPIRRYADLVNHRCLDTYLFQTKLKSASPTQPYSYSKAELKSLAQHLSNTEANSTEAERESLKLKLLEYFERELKGNKRKQFEAVISNIMSHGLFVELTETGAWGLVPMESLRRDRYTLHPNRDALLDRNTGEAFRMGSKVRVAVAAVDRFKRQINFHFA